MEEVWDSCIMLNHNYDNGVCYSFFSVNPQNGNRQKIYNVNNKSLKETHFITHFPVKHNDEYVFSINYDGLKLSTHKDDTKIYYSDKSDNIIYQSFKSNPNSDTSRQNIFPILFNGSIGIADILHKKFKSTVDTFGSRFIKGIFVEKEIMLYVFEDYFILSHLPLFFLHKFSFGEKIKDIDVGKNNKEEFSLCVTTETKTSYIKLDKVAFNILDREQYYVSGDSTITDTDEIYTVTKNHLHKLGRTTHSSNLELPTNIFTDNDNIILQDEHLFINTTKDFGRMIKFENFVLTRENSILEGFKNFDISVETISTVSEMKLMTIDKIPSAFIIS